METIYLVDFENVHNDGVKNIFSLTRDDHVHIFYTEKDKNISPDIALAKNTDVIGHKVSSGTESLDKHLASYLGYMLAQTKGKKCDYVIISKDKGYDKIIEFWTQEEGFTNVTRKDCIEDSKQKTTQTKEKEATTSTSSNNTLNAKISAGMSYDLSGEDRSELNTFVQHELLKKKYKADVANRICKYVISHCNDDKILNLIHNDLRREYPDKYTKYYDDVKVVLDKFVTTKSKRAVKEQQIKSIYGRQFKKKIHRENKDATINILLNAQTRQGVNNDLLKLYGDNELVSEMLKVFQPQIKDLPGR